VKNLIFHLGPCAIFGSNGKWIINLQKGSIGNKLELMAKDLIISQELDWKR